MSSPEKFEHQPTDEEELVGSENRGSDNENVEETKGNPYEGQYTGVCDVYSPEEAIAMADVLRRERKNPNRKIMIGVMTHPLVLMDRKDRPENLPEEVFNSVREGFPTREELAGGFTDDPDVLNTIHYADLYGPNGPWGAGESPNLLNHLESCVEYGGENLHAIQLDLTWPDPSEIKEFKEKYPDVIIILQVGKFALKEVDDDYQEVIKRLGEYGDSVDHVLLDVSMGKGKSMNANKLLPLLRLISEELPDLGLAVAGGLGPDYKDELHSIAREFPDVSIDAQGNLKHKDAPRDDLGHLVATHPAELERSDHYIQWTSGLLDNKPK